MRDWWLFFLYGQFSSGYCHSFGRSFKKCSYFRLRARQPRTGLAANVQAFRQASTSAVKTFELLNGSASIDQNRPIFRSTMSQVCVEESPLQVRLRRSYCVARRRLWMRSQRLLWSNIRCTMRFKRKVMS